MSRIILNDVVKSILKGDRRVLEHTRHIQYIRRVICADVLCSRDRDQDQGSAPRGSRTALEWWSGPGNAKVDGSIYFL